MILKLRHFFIFIFIFCYTANAQVIEGTGFGDSESEKQDIILTKQLLSSYQDSLIKNKGQFILVGGIMSIFRAPILDANIHCTIDGIKYQTLSDSKGRYFFSGNATGKATLIDLTITHPEYHTLDTSFILEASEKGIVPIFSINPKFKILLRGRVYAQNVPLEDVSVTIAHQSDTFNVQTLGCYYDDEDFWNCLYHGMFKQDIIANDPNDSIYIYMERDGFEPYSTALKFADYKGNMMKVKMKYNHMLPEFPTNNISLKLAFPFMADGNWFVNLGYQRILDISGFKRLGIGIESTVMVSNISVDVPTFPGLDHSVADSSYPIGFIGPQATLWITDPMRRSFSFYTGGNINILFNTGKLAPQAFLGARFFVDINKAISIEARYVSYDIDVVHYTFDPLGNAQAYEKSKHNEQILFNAGLHVTF